MKEKFCILKIIEGTPLQLAFVRSLLFAENLIYVEIDAVFYISCTKVFKDNFSQILNSSGIKYILMYVNSKVGCDVFANGINSLDEQKIKEITLKQVV